jgi:hypothetical protein
MALRAGARTRSVAAKTALMSIKESENAVPARVAPRGEGRASRASTMDPLRAASRAVALRESLRRPLPAAPSREGVSGAAEVGGRRATDRRPDLHRVELSADFAQAQADGAVDHASVSLERRIRAHLNRGALDITLTDNRYTMISVRRERRQGPCTGSGSTTCSPTPARASPGRWPTTSPATTATPRGCWATTSTPTSTGSRYRRRAADRRMVTRGRSTTCRRSTTTSTSATSTAHRRPHHLGPALRQAAAPQQHQDGQLLGRGQAHPHPPLPRPRLRPPLLRRVDRLSRDAPPGAPGASGSSTAAAQFPHQEFLEDEAASSTTRKPAPGSAPTSTTY